LASKPKATLTQDEARRIALAAQGFAYQSRDGKSGWPKIARTIEDLHLLQIDSVNVLVRSHYLPLFSRLGNYDTAALDKRSLDHGNRHVFECWAHEASFVPLALHPLMRWRMERARAGDGIYHSMDRFGRENRAYLREILAHIGANGPIRASEVPGGGKAEGGWWGWSKGKMALETLFDQGLVTAAARKGFERIYDLTERVIPAAILATPTPSESDTFQQLITLAAQALGIATETDLRDYFRLPPQEARKAIADCVEAGTLEAVSVDGWKKPTFMPRGTRLPRKGCARQVSTPSFRLPSQSGMSWCGQTPWNASISSPSRRISRIS
jgi:uncharacterized protein YcaQ